MKNYLSFGGGVNSVAMYLYLLDQNVNFEAIFVDHGADYPETYDYVEMFRKKYPITILKPDLGNLYDYFLEHQLLPSVRFRYCTGKFKLRPIYRYVDTPCFMMIGIDFGESHRAKISHRKNVENRFPLIEAEINREDCKQIITDAGLPVPQKSGCYICPFQSKYKWRLLRKNYPDLFCKAKKLEEAGLKRKKYTLVPGINLESVVDEKQHVIFEEDKYPPCLCGL